MSAPTSGSSGSSSPESPTPGYYPDPSIPHYIRYWNGSSWVPGTSQPAPAGSQPQVGSKIPDSMSAQALPSNVTDQVPEATNLFFVKLPDRIILIDPDTKMVTEIVMEATTTGSSPASSSPPSR